MKIYKLALPLTLATLCLPALGCLHDHCCGGGRGARGYAAFGPAYDRPFPLGQVTDSFWETQQTNAEAADFIFYDHEFVDNTALLTPGGKQHIEQVALRLEHVPFPVVIEQSEYNIRPEMDQARRRMIVEQLARMGVVNVEPRVVIADAFPEGVTALEGEQAYYSTLGSGTGGVGGRFGGRGGTYR